MSKFFVGCQVRKVRGTSAIGARGRICALGVNDQQFDGQVRLVCFAVNKLTGQEFEPGDAAWVILHQWEPIIPDGQKPSDQSFEQLMGDLKKGVIHA